jgi:periplasmic copper chaperone A
MKTTRGRGSFGRCRPPGVLLAAFAILLLAQSAGADAPVEVTHARIRLLPGDLPLAGYFDAANHGPRAVALTGASSPAFRMIHVHRSLETGGTSMMKAVSAVDINPGETVQFAPGGYHLMLMERTRPLRVGDEVPIHLKFADGATLDVNFIVNGAATE